MLQKKQKKAFTLIELLVVIAIIALLLSILLPSLRLIKENAKFLICKTNMKQIGVAIYAYAQSNDDRIVSGDGHGVTLCYGTDVYTLGHLFTSGLLPEPTDNKGSVIYCPSDKADWYHEDGTMQVLGVDRSWENNWMVPGGEPVHCSYEFRDSLDGNWNGACLPPVFEECKGARIYKISRQVLLSSWIIPDYMEYQHDWRYDYLVGDGSVSVLDERQHKDQDYTLASDPEDPHEVGITGICDYYNYVGGNRVYDYIPYDAIDYLLGNPHWKIPLLDGEAPPPQLAWRSRP